MVTDSAVMIRVFEIDSMFMHADTLYAHEDTVTHNKIWTAFHNVRMYKTDLQGKCDSLVYSSIDSLISFYHNPVLWSDENQLTAEFMDMELRGSQIDKLHLYNSSFIISREDTDRFNQVRGRNMTGFFEDNNLYKIHVEGNGQSIYYSKNSKEQFTGVNTAECCDMLNFMNENKVSTISLLNAPDATLYPINELSSGELKLKGFLWLDEVRPLNRDDIFRRN